MSRYGGIMQRPRPVGVVIFGSLFIIMGILLFLINTNKWWLIMGIPVKIALFYVRIFPAIWIFTGISIFLIKPWVERLILYVVPVLTFFYFFFYYYLAIERGCSYQPGMSKIVDAIQWNRILEYLFSGEVILVIIPAVITMGPVVLYFTRPKVRKLYRGN